MAPKIALRKRGDPQSQGQPDGIKAGRNEFVSINLKYTTSWAHCSSHNGRVHGCVVLFTLVSILLCG